MFHKQYQVHNISHTWCHRSIIAGEICSRMDLLIHHVLRNTVAFRERFGDVDFIINQRKKIVVALTKMM